MKTVLVAMSIMLSSLFTLSAEEGGKDGFVTTRSPSLTIDPKFRAQDYQQIFETLRKEKPANKVCVYLMDGTKVFNIIDMRLMGNNTVFLLRYNTPQGIKLQAIELECIQSIGCLE